MAENLKSHRVLKLVDQERWEWKWFLSDDFEEQLDPYGDNVPFEARRVSDELLEIDREFKDAVSSGLSKTCPGKEQGWMGVNINWKDFTGNYRCTELSTCFHAYEEDGVRIASDEATYYIYDNGIGIFRNIAIRDKGLDGVEETILHQRFVTVQDLPTIGLIRDLLLKRD